MLALEEKILQEGQVLDNGVLRVGSFLNQQIDVELTDKMAQEVCNIYKDEPINKILTVEASGIPFAYAVAQKLGVPMVFAKKRQAINLGDSFYKSPVYSYTYKKTYDIAVSKEYISEGDKILIVDDFLAYGKALMGLIDLVNQSDATLIGAAIAIERTSENGGNMIRSKGVRIESLAKIESIENGEIKFRH